MAITIKFAKGERGIEEILRLIAKTDEKVRGAKTIEELLKIEADLKIGFDSMQTAVPSETTLVKSAVSEFIHILKKEMSEIQKNISSKKEEMLKADAKASMDELLAEAKKWLARGHKDLAHSCLRAYASIARKFSIPYGDTYGHLLGKCVVC